MKEEVLLRGVDEDGGGGEEEEERALPRVQVHHDDEGLAGFWGVIDGIDDRQVLERMFQKRKGGKRNAV